MELNWILGNKNHDTHTQKNSIRFNPACNCGCCRTVRLSYGWLVRRNLSRLPEQRRHDPVPPPPPPPTMAAEDRRLCKAGRHFLTGAFKYITVPSERRCLFMSLKDYWAVKAYLSLYKRSAERQCGTAENMMLSPNHLELCGRDMTCQYPAWGS